jgi:hypothetical protein
MALMLACKDGGSGQREGPGCLTWQQAKKQQAAGRLEGAGQGHAEVCCAARKHGGFPGSDAPTQAGTGPHAC